MTEQVKIPVRNWNSFINAWERFEKSVIEQGSEQAVISYAAAVQAEIWVMATAAKKRPPKGFSDYAEALEKFRKKQRKR